MKKTIFITGASSGLGKEAAKLFASKGWDVIATMRNPAKETDLNKVANVRLMALDVTNPEQVNAVAAEVVQSTKVDVVFNNAGYGLAGPFEGATDEDLVKEVNTNLMGVMRVTKAFIPHMRENKSGTFITTTSIGGLIAFPFNTVYHATKWGLEGWSESLSYELATFGIKVKTVAPGGIRTDFAGRSLVLTQHPAYQEKLESATKIFFDPKRDAQRSSALQIAEVVYEAATDGKSQVRYVAGKDANMLWRLRRWFGQKFFMKQIQKRFMN